MSHDALTQYRVLLHQAQADLMGAGVYDLEKQAGILDWFARKGVDGAVGNTKAIKAIGDAVEGSAVPLRAQALPTSGAARQAPVWDDFSELVGRRAPDPASGRVGAPSPAAVAPSGPPPRKGLVAGRGAQAEPRGPAVLERGAGPEAAGAEVPRYRPQPEGAEGAIDRAADYPATVRTPEAAPPEAGKGPKPTVDVDGDGTPDMAEAPEGPSMWNRMGRMGAATGGLGLIGGGGYLAGKGSGEEEAQRRRNLAFGAGMASGVAAPRVLQGVGDRLQSLGSQMQAGYGPQPAMYGGY